MKYFFDTISSKAYWQYVLFSKSGGTSLLAIYGCIYLFIESLDFFQIFKRDQYGSYAFIIFLLISLIISIVIRRPIKSITLHFPHCDFSVEVRIGDLFDASGAVMISTNTVFEADVAGGKIAVDSLQGQFTARYFTGNQSGLINEIENQLKARGGTKPYPIGTTIPISTHGKTFYFTSMAVLNEQGNASSSIQDIKNALNGLWLYLRESGELQELAIPIVGTGRGRVQLSRNKMIALIAESFVSASEKMKFSEKLVVCIRPEDAKRFKVNLYDVKDHLDRVLKD